jgi:hypothetical protein
VQHHGNIASSLMGLVSVWISKVIGIISIASIGQAIILGAAGAAGGWLFKYMFSIAKRLIQNQIKNQIKK